METISMTLKERYQELLANAPKTRIRNAAKELGVSEAELLATNIGDTVTVLEPKFQAILGEIETLGNVMALTRNNEVVHERKGKYLNPELENAHVGLFVGEDIDLRIFFASWKYAFAVVEPTDTKPRKSLQFFANDGEAIHKIYLTATSNESAFEALVNKYTAANQNIEFDLVETKKQEELADSEIDVEAFRDGWVNLKDTHHFFGLVRKYNLTRTQALRLAPSGNYSIKIDPKAIVNTLQKAAERNVEIMVFVGNKGMIQIHTGPVNNLLEQGPWYNVIDPIFNLHVNMQGITDAWVVRKPTEDGMVTAIECFNSEGEQVVQFFGKRKPGIPELESWREIVAEVETETKL